MKQSLKLIKGKALQAYASSKVIYASRNEIAGSIKTNLKTFWETWQDHKKAEAALQKYLPENNDDRQFLPAELEIQESPPSSTARILMWTLVCLTVFSITWGALGRVDIVAVGQGKIIPSGHTKVIQPLETGVIKAIHVKSGQSIKQGDLLVELDITQTNADRLRFKNEWIQTKADIQRLNALLTNTELEVNDNLSQEMLDIQKQYLDQQKSEQVAITESLKQAVAQKEAELSSIQQDIKRLESTLPLVREKSQMIEDLAESGISSKYETLTIKEEVITKEKEFEILKERRKEIEAAVEGAKAQLDSAEAEFKKNTLAELTQKEIAADTLEKEFTKADKRNQLQSLLSPIDGKIQELSIHTIGGVVTPAQELMKIVPQDATLEAEISLQNKDVGFVEAGQKVAIKLDAFPFTKYGMIDGEVLNVSHDAVQDEQLGLVFKAKLSMEQNSIKVGKKDILLTPGMSLSGEVKTGHRRIIEYFLSPVLKYQAEVIRER
jgi:hemolysin D